jgi:hypothetical protein
MINLQAADVAKATNSSIVPVAIASYTVGAADGTFIVSGNVNLTAVTTASFTLAHLLVSLIMLKVI